MRSIGRDRYTQIGVGSSGGIHLHCYSPTLIRLPSHHIQSYRLCLACWLALHILVIIVQCPFTDFGEAF